MRYVTVHDEANAQFAPKNRLPWMRVLLACTLLSFVAACGGGGGGGGGGDGGGDIALDFGVTFERGPIPFAVKATLELTRAEPVAAGPERRRLVPHELGDLRRVGRQHHLVQP